MRFIATALAFASLAGAAAAQTASPSPRAVQLAHDVYQALGGETQMTAMADRLTQQMSAGFPTLTVDGKDVRADAVAFAHAELLKFAPQMSAGVERVYAETFTEAELQDLLAFYRTPTGRAFAAKLPDIGTRTGVVLAPIVKQMQADILNHMCDLRGCTPEQRAQIAKLTGG